MAADTPLRTTAAEGRYGRAQRLEYLRMIDAVGARWVAVFAGDTTFYSAAYWDLLTAIWGAGKPVRKTDALGFMKAVKSAHTAGKYVRDALAEGLIVETPNSADGRSKLVDLSPRMRRRLDAFFDAAVDQLKAACARLEGKG